MLQPSSSAEPERERLIHEGLGHSQQCWLARQSMALPLRKPGLADGFRRGLIRGFKGRGQRENPNLALQTAFAFHAVKPRSQNIPNLGDAVMNRNP